MDEVSKKSEKIQEPSFQLNYATVILLLVIIIPLGYTIWVNLQDAMPNPALTTQLPAKTKAVPASQTTSTASAAETLILARQASADKPSFQTYINLGLAFYAVDSTENAIHAWEKAIDYNPKSALTYNNIAAAYGKLDRWDDEIAACRKALQIDTGFALAKNNMQWAIGKKNGK